MMTPDIAEKITDVLQQAWYAKSQMPMNPKSKAEMERQYEDALNKIRRHFSGAEPIQVHKPGLNSKDNIWAWWLDQITYAYDHSRGREGKILRAHPDLDLVLPELLKLALDVQPPKNPNFGKFFH